MMFLSITLFFLPFLETFHSKYRLVSFDKAISNILSERAQRTDEEGGNILKSLKFNSDNYILF